MSILSFETECLIEDSGHWLASKLWGPFYLHTPFQFQSYRHIWPLEHWRSELRSLCLYSRCPTRGASSLYLNVSLLVPQFSDTIALKGDSVTMMNVLVHNSTPNYNLKYPIIPFQSNGLVDWCCSERAVIRYNSAWGNWNTGSQAASQACWLRLSGAGPKLFWMLKSIQGYTKAYVYLRATELSFYLRTEASWEHL